MDNEIKVTKKIGLKFLQDLEKSLENPPESQPNKPRPIKSIKYNNFQKSPSQKTLNTVRFTNPDPQKQSSQYNSKTIPDSYNTQSIKSYIVQNLDKKTRPRSKSPYIQKKLDQISQNFVQNNLLIHIQRQNPQNLSKTQQDPMQNSLKKLQNDTLESISMNKTLEYKTQNASLPKMEKLVNSINHVKIPENLKLLTKKSKSLEKTYQNSPISQMAATTLLNNKQKIDQLLQKQEQKQQKWDKVSQNVSKKYSQKQENLLLKPGKFDQNLDKNLINSMYTTVKLNEEERQRKKQNTENYMYQKHGLYFKMHRVPEDKTYQGSEKFKNYYEIENIKDTLYYQQQLELFSDE